MVPNLEKVDSDHSNCAALNDISTYLYKYAVYTAGLINIVLVDSGYLIQTIILAIVLYQLRKGTASRKNLI